MDLGTEEKQWKRWQGADDIAHWLSARASDQSEAVLGRRHGDIGTELRPFQLTRLAILPRRRSSEEKMGKVEHL